MTSAPDVSVIVVSYRTRELTLTCLRTLFAETRETRLQTIVLDNDSDDGSADAVAKEFEQVELIRSSDNLGFAGGNNRAAEIATGDWILLLNPDTEVRDGAIDRLVAFARERERSDGPVIVGGRTIFENGSLNPGSCWGRPTPWSVFCIASGLAKIFSNSTWTNPEALGGWRRDTVREVDIVSGCFLMLRRELWNELGGFDPQFFMYGEDADLCLRARERGAHCWITPDATIVHHGGRSERVRADKMIRLFKAKAQLFRRYWSGPEFGLGRWLLKLWVLTRYAAHRLRSLAPTEGFTTWRNIWDARDEWLLEDDA